MLKEKEFHEAATGATERIGGKGNKKRESPTSKRAKKRMLRGMNGRDKASILNRGR